MKKKGTKIEKNRKREKRTYGEFGSTKHVKKKKKVETEGGGGIGQTGMEKQLEVFNRSKKTPRLPKKEGKGLRMIEIVKK